MADDQPKTPLQVEPAGAAPAMRIAELSRRSGVSAHLIRMWERRYGLLRPLRDASGYRLYGPGDLALLLAVRAQRDAGVPAAEAVARVLRRERATLSPARPAPGAPGHLDPPDEPNATTPTETPPAEATTSRGATQIETTPTETSPTETSPTGGKPADGDRSGGGPIDPTPRPSLPGAILPGPPLSEPPASPARRQEWVRRLHEGVDGLDEAAIAAVLDEIGTSMSFGEALQEMYIPFLHRLGERWASRDVLVVHEHFATMILRRRWSAATQAWDVSDGPLVLLACPPGEQHDLMPLAFGILLAESGWRVRLFGADTPLRDIAHVSRELRPDLVVLSTRSQRLLRRDRPGFAAVRDAVGAGRFAVAGRGATIEVAHLLGATRLPGSPSEVAQQVTRDWRAHGRHAPTSPRR